MSISALMAKQPVEWLLKFRREPLGPSCGWLARLSFGALATEQFNQYVRIRRCRRRQIIAFADAALPARASGLGMLVGITYYQLAIR